MFKLIRKERAKYFDTSKDYLIILDDQMNLELHKSDNVEFSEKLEGDFTNVNSLDYGEFLIKKDDNTALVLKRISTGYELSPDFNEVPISDINEEKDIAFVLNWISYYPVEIESKFIDLKSKNVLWSSKNITSCSMIRDVLISIEHENLVVYKLHDGRLKSRFDLTPYLIGFTTTDQSKSENKIQNYIGLTGSILWIGFSSGRLLAIDIERGSKEHLIGFKESDLPQFPFEVKEGDYLPFGELMQLDEDKGEIIGLRDKYFIKVDLGQSKPRRKYIDVGQSMAAYKISSSYRNYSFPIDEQFIYFCDDRQGKIGVFDREKKEVVWSYKLDMERDGIAQILEMKYANNQWYVLDRNDTLHIFERIA